MFYKSNKTGWKNAVNVLNSIGDIYGHGNGATGGRSIQETDISAYSNYNLADYKNNQHQTNGTADNLGYYYYTGNSNRYETETYTSGTFIMDDNSEVTATESSPVTMKQTYYGYTGSSYIANPYYNLIFRQSTNTSAWKPNFWVAARYVSLHPSYCYFGVRGVSSGNVISNWLVRFDWVRGQPFLCGRAHGNSTI